MARTQMIVPGDSLLNNVLSVWITSVSMVYRILFLFIVASVDNKIVAHADILFGTF